MSYTIKNKSNGFKLQYVNIKAASFNQILHGQKRTSRVLWLSEVMFYMQIRLEAERFATYSKHMPNSQSTAFKQATYRDVSTSKPLMVSYKFE
jgi:hypothetical protein